MINTLYYIHSRVLLSTAFRCCRPREMSSAVKRRRLDLTGIEQSEEKNAHEENVGSERSNNCTPTSASEDAVPAFKQEFKYYKSKHSVPNMHDVIDLEIYDAFSDELQPFALRSPDLADDCLWKQLGLAPINEWRAFQVKRHPGLYLIRSALSLHGQYRWADLCLKTFTAKPNVTNIDSFLPNSNYAIFDHPNSMRKLRWVTLGYHHNWETKQYSEDYKSPTPPEMTDLCRIVAKTLGYRNFVAEAAIIHYYHLDSTLSGHVDRSERNLDAPLLSFSLGQSALFLMGGTSLNEVPSAMLLRSGDVMVMSGPSRLAYHAVPRMLKDRTFSHSTLVGHDPKVVQYLNEHRLNMNVRQVNFYDVE